MAQSTKTCRYRQVGFDLSKSPLTSLLERTKVHPEEMDIRLEDYLNDKLQTSSDFEELDALIDNVEVQRVQLEEQLEDAQRELADARRASQNHTSVIKERMQDFQALQTSVDARLKALTASDTVEDATQRMKEPMEKLRRLQLAEAYVDLLKDVNQLAADARQHLPAHPKEALKPYIRLRQLAIYLASYQEAAEGAGTHLVAYVDQSADSLWREMKKIMSSEFEAVLKATNWPTSDQKLAQEWSDCFRKLLDLQAPELLNEDKPVILLPMAVLTKTFIQQFRYNFMRESAPGLLKGKDHIFFDWFLATVGKWAAFLQDNVGPVLAEHFRESPLVKTSVYVDPVSAFITAYLPVMREKINSIIPFATKDPQALSSLIHQILAFDASLRTDYAYDGGCPPGSEWKGLAGEMLTTWFDRWLSVERDFALARYEDIIASKNNGLLDYDSTGPGKTKPTYGATMVTDLLGSITGLYEPLRTFSYKIRFLIDVQLAILDMYHNRLRDSLDAYQALTSTVGRTLHGVSKEQQALVEGTGGLESLCKVFGSCEHVIATTKDWNNSVFFVDLWNELQARARRADERGNLAGPKSYADVKSSTSQSVGSGEDGALFDEITAAYGRLRDAAEGLLVEAIRGELVSAMRPYLKKPQWTTVDVDSEASADATSTITAELDAPLSLLSSHMVFLSRTLASPPFRRILYPVLSHLQDTLYNDVLLRENFTTIGAAQFGRDLDAIVEVVEGYAPALGRSLGRVREAAQVLGMKVDSDGGDKEGDGGNGDDGKKGWGQGLKKVAERIFRSNQEAKDVVEELGLRELDYREVRGVVGRRVEVSD